MTADLTRNLSASHPCTGDFHHHVASGRWQSINPAAGTVPCNQPALSPKCTLTTTGCPEKEQQGVVAGTEACLPSPPGPLGTCIGPRTTSSTHLGHCWGDASLAVPSSSSALGTSNHCFTWYHFGWVLSTHGPPHQARLSQHEHMHNRSPCNPAHWNYPS